LGLEEPDTFDAFWYAYVFTPAREAEADPQSVIDREVARARGRV